MDKLKEILVYKFWILVGLALLFPLVGWWMATASIGEAYETRVKELDDKFKKIPPLTPTPNSKWIEPVKQINVQEAARVQETRELLLQHQQSLMTWPKDVSDVVEELEYL